MPAHSLFPDQRGGRLPRPVAHIKIACAILFVSAAIVPGAVDAAQLRVEPILVELTVPTVAGTLTLRNDEDVEVAVQTRVFRWSQSGGRENLEPATEVVASPPVVKLAPHADYTVRIVRTSKQPVHGEESYRVVVDQLPDPQRQRQAGAVNILVRQSIPVFFRASQLTKADVSWSLARQGGSLVVTVSNGGDERLRIASLRLRDAAGATIDFGNGLLGYSLGRSSIGFVATNPPHGFGAAGRVTIAAETNNGPIRTTAALQIQR